MRVQVLLELRFASEAESVNFSSACSAAGQELWEKVDQVCCLRETLEAETWSLREHQSVSRLRVGLDRRLGRQGNLQDLLLAPEGFVLQCRELSERWGLV